MDGRARRPCHAFTSGADVSRRKVTRVVAQHLAVERVVVAVQHVLDAASRGVLPRHPVAADQIERGVGADIARLKLSTPFRR